ncbi:MerT mercuric transport protein [Gillisia sp. Hel1_33_143]|uniref:hypothetical protein n=1 Tax=Gillisia sp. Hel_I_29 TaxID=1249975 RepID=UPI00068C5D02|nr:hypothetical protein [Gillisia sp. Hel_I_29]SDR67796.1 MerT mercuric transport protein [Gillisia sp. Hel1_33_143]
MLKKNALLGTSLLTAGVPFLCCWTPAVLIGIAGFTGMSSNFEWLHPIRPYLYGVSFLSLGFAFYNTYGTSKAKSSGENKDVSECGCKKSALNSTKNKWILWTTTFLVFIMIVINFLLD